MAKVIKHFTGVVDGKIHPVLHSPGDEVHGELARVAIAEGWAEATKVFAAATDRLRDAGAALVAVADQLRKVAPEPPIKKKRK